jgi:hypothetical protein
MPLVDFLLKMKLGWRTHKRHFCHKVVFIIYLFIFPWVTFTNFGTTHIFEEIRYTSKTHKTIFLYHKILLDLMEQCIKHGVEGKVDQKDSCLWIVEAIKITTFKWMAIVMIPTSLCICNSHWMTSTKRSNGWCSMMTTNIFGSLSELKIPKTKKNF